MVLYPYLYLYLCMCLPLTIVVIPLSQFSDFSPPEVSLGALGVLLLLDSLLLLAPASLGCRSGHGGAQHHRPFGRGMVWDVMGCWCFIVN